MRTDTELFFFFCNFFVIMVKWYPVSMYHSFGFWIACHIFCGWSWNCHAALLLLSGLLSVAIINFSVLSKFSRVGPICDPT